MSWLGPSRRCLVLSCDPLAFLCHPLPSLVAALSLSLSAMEQVLPAFGRTLFQSIGEYYCVRHCLYVAPYSQASLPQLLHIHTYGHHSVSVASSNVRTSALWSLWNPWRHCLYVCKAAHREIRNSPSLSLRIVPSLDNMRNLHVRIDRAHRVHSSGHLSAALQDRSYLHTYDDDDDDDDDDDNNNVGSDNDNDNDNDDTLSDPGLLSFFCSMNFVMWWMRTEVPTDMQSRGEILRESCGI